MLGLINDCAEQLVISKYGVDVWHAIKESAGCKIKDDGFEQHGHYPDSATVDIVVAAAEALSVTVEDLLELLGRYFLEYIIDKGYDNLLRCQGSTLRLWLSNLNAMHDHLQSSLPAGNFPVFWCENCVTHDGSIILHYYSTRGALLSSLVVGIVKEVAKTYFQIEVKMLRLAVQGEDGSECTTWRISSVDPLKRYKLTQQGSKDSDAVSLHKTIDRRATLRHNNKRGSSCRSGVFDSIEPITNGICPFSGADAGVGCTDDVVRSMRNLETGDAGAFLRCGSSDDLGGDEEKRDTEKVAQEKMIRRRMSRENLRRISSSSALTQLTAPEASSGAFLYSHGNSPSREGWGKSDGDMMYSIPDDNPPSGFELGLPSEKVRSIFPYHVVSFSVCEVLSSIEKHYES